MISLDLAKIEEDFFQAKFIVKKLDILSESSFKKYEKIIDIISDIILEPEENAFEIEKLILLKYLSNELSNRYSIYFILDTIDYSSFETWKTSEIINYGIKI